MAIYTRFANDIAKTKFIRLNGKDYEGRGVYCICIRMGKNEANCKPDS